MSTRPDAKPSQNARRLRSDTRRNQRRMFEAVAEIARESPESLTMQAIAHRAEIGAWRRPQSVQTLLAVRAQPAVDSAA